jgi:hypothetical protein
MALTRVIGLTTYPVHDRGRPLAVREVPAPGPPKLRLLDRVREALRTRHYSDRTEEAYIAWIRRYIFFHGEHPPDMGGAEVTRFLSALAVEGRVAASTQNQALGALLFLNRDVLGVELPWLDEIVRAAARPLIRSRTHSPRFGRRFSRSPPIIRAGATGWWRGLASLPA